jgi:hypothetical protein
MHLSLRAFRAGLATAAMLALACTTEEAAGPTFEDLALRLAEVECASRLAGECGEPSWPDEQACVEQRAAELRDAYTGAEAMGRRYDPECAESLLEPTAAETCSAVCSLFIGDKRLGEPCNDEGAGSDCDAATLCSGGTCVERSLFTPAAEGERCTNDEGASSRPCRFGLLCDQSNGVCIIAPAEGAPCADVNSSEPVECGRGFFCELEQRVCQRLRAEGEPCDPIRGELSCESYTCEEGMCAPLEPAWCAFESHTPETSCVP